MYSTCVYNLITKYIMVRATQKRENRAFLIVNSVRTVHQFENRDFSFLCSSHHNVFHLQNLHTCRIHPCKHVWFYSEFFETLKYVYAILFLKRPPRRSPDIGILWYAIRLLCWVDAILVEWAMLNCVGVNWLVCIWWIWIFDQQVLGFIRMKQITFSQMVDQRCPWCICVFFRWEGTGICRSTTRTKRWSWAVAYSVRCRLGGQGSSGGPWHPWTDNGGPVRSEKEKYGSLYREPDSCWRESLWKPAMWIKSSSELALR